MYLTLLFIIYDTQCLFWLSPTWQSTHTCYVPNLSKETAWNNPQAITKTGHTKASNLNTKINSPQLKNISRVKEGWSPQWTPPSPFALFGVLFRSTPFGSCPNEQARSIGRTEEHRLQIEIVSSAVPLLHLQPWEKLSYGNADQCSLSKDDTKDLDFSQYKNLK